MKYQTINFTNLTEVQEAVIANLGPQSTCLAMFAMQALFAMAARDLSFRRGYVAECVDLALRFADISEVVEAIDEKVDIEGRPGRAYSWLSNYLVDLIMEVGQKEEGK